MYRSGIFFAAALLIVGAGPSLADQIEHFDTMIVGGTVFDGSTDAGVPAAVGIRDDRITYVGDPGAIDWEAQQVVDANERYVVPGFIDPHTHSLQDLLNVDARQNINYLTQGVTTVVVGNDGEGPPNIASLSSRLVKQGMGTNVAFFVGHGAIRSSVMGAANRAPDAQELEQMRRLVRRGMTEGALGLSTGLYYSPGNFAATEEVIALAREAAVAGGVYETHLRDESSYSIGFLAALQEALDIGLRADIPVHVGHIKALGVDVWGQSEEAVALIEEAIASGQKVTADQYPWSASGTHMHNAVMPRWALADSQAHYQARLRDESLRDELLASVADNIRRRGGAESLLIATCPNPVFIGKTLAEVAAELNLPAPEAALIVLRLGMSRVISFNMSDEDIEHFMRQPWVMTSSDGNERHPRKYASFPKKYQQYVLERGLMSFADFVNRSSGLTAQTFRLEDRGFLRDGYFADVVVLDPDGYRANASYLSWDELSSGVQDMFVNGQAVILDGEIKSGSLPGRALARKKVPQ